MAKSFSGRSWVDIRTSARYKTEFDKLKTHVTRLPGEVMKGYYAEVRDIAWKIVYETRQYILDDTRTKKYQETGEKGRIDTGKMVASFWTHVDAYSEKGYKVNLGYLAGKPGYAIFQEYGTRQGLVGVEALRFARDRLDEELRKMRGGGRNYVPKIADAMTSPGGTPPAWFNGKK